MHAFCQQIAEAGQRYGCPRACPVGERLIQAKRAENDTGDDIACQNSCRSQLCAVNEYLAYHAEQPAHSKSLYIRQYDIHTEPPSNGIFYGDGMAYAGDAVALLGAGGGH